MNPSWWAHTLMSDKGVTIRFCPRCNLVIGVKAGEEGLT